MTSEEHSTGAGHGNSQVFGSCFHRANSAAPRLSVLNWNLTLCRFFSSGLFMAEDPIKNFIYIAQLPVEIKGMVELFARQARGDLLVLPHQGTKVQPMLPGAHGIFLYYAVGVLAQHAALGEIEQKLPAEDQAAGAFQVLFHASGVDEHLFN